MTPQRPETNSDNNEKVNNNPNPVQLDSSPVVTKFAENPYMDLKTKPSDAPNSIFSLITGPRASSKNALRQDSYSGSQSNQALPRSSAFIAASKH